MPPRVDPQSLTPHPSSLARPPPTYLMRFLAKCFVWYVTQAFPDTASNHACAVRSLASTSTLHVVWAVVRAHWAPKTTRQWGCSPASKKE